jgi:hypothetical protein
VRTGHINLTLTLTVTLQEHLEEPASDSSYHVLVTSWSASCLDCYLDSHTSGAPRDGVKVITCRPCSGALDTLSLIVALALTLQEHLEMGSGSSQAELGRQLARMHLAAPSVRAATGDLLRV